MRVGIGYDSHRFAEDRPLILAGIRIPHALGLDGHSDADAVCHAVTDAVLGAAALGDIGSHFPPSDERWRDADSLRLLETALDDVRAAGFRVLNIDVTLVCEAPKIGPHVGAMRERLAASLGMAADEVSIKAKTNEGMGWIGRGEGIAAMAVALLDRTDGR